MTRFPWTVRGRITYRTPTPARLAGRFLRALKRDFNTALRKEHVAAINAGADTLTYTRHPWGTWPRLRWYTNRIPKDYRLLYNAIRRTSSGSIMVETGADRIVVHYELNIAAPVNALLLCLPALLLALIVIWGYTSKELMLAIAPFAGLIGAYFLLEAIWAALGPRLLWRRHLRWIDRREGGRRVA